MPNKIERLHSVTESISLTADPTTSARIPYGAVAGGMVFVDALATGTKIIWYAAPARGDSAYPVYDFNNLQETYISASRAYPVPDGCYSAPFLVPVLDAGTATISLSVKG